MYRIGCTARAGHVSDPQCLNVMLLSMSYIDLCNSEIYNPFIQIIIQYPPIYIPIWYWTCSMTKELDCSIYMGLSEIRISSNLTVDHHLLH